MEDVYNNESEAESLLPSCNHAEDDTDTDALKRKLRFICVKNCFVIALIFYCNYAAINGLSSLASSLNQETVVAMSVFAFTGIIGSYVSPIIVSKLGAKFMLTVSVFSSLVYVLMEFYPRYYTLVPMSALAGTCAGVSWTVQMMYSTNTALVYARLSNKPVDAIMEYSYGIFFVFFSLSQVSGNLISALILGTFNNVTLLNENSTNMCGSQFCPQFLDNITVLEHPTASSVSILVTVFAIIVFIGLLLTLFGLDRLSAFEDLKDVRHIRTTCEQLYSPVKVFLQTNMLLLATLYVYIGIEQNVIISDYNEAYITCTLHPSYVGYFMICYGSAQALGSFLSGLTGPIVGRNVVVASTLALLLCGHGFMFLVDIRHISFGLFFVCPILFGASDGALRTQLNALVGILFSDNQEPAYGVINMLTLFGFGIVFAYNAAFCVVVKLSISTAVLGCSGVLYVVFYCKTGRHLAYNVDKSYNKLLKNKCTEHSLPKREDIG